MSESCEFAKRKRKRGPGILKNSPYINRLYFLWSEENIPIKFFGIKK